MADSDSENDNISPGDPKQQVRSSPTAGCIIIMLAFALFAGIAGYGIYAGITQDRDIAKFASEEKLELPKVEATNDESNALRAEFKAWETAAKTGQNAELKLTARDLNIVVNNFNALMETRGTIYFEKVEADRIHAQISMPMNRIAFWKEPRYLNGTCTLKVESAEGRIFLRFDTFDIPKATPILGFVERMQQSDLIGPYKADDDLKKVFDESILSAQIEGDTIIVRTKPMHEE